MLPRGVIDADKDVTFGFGNLVVTGNPDKKVLEE